MRDFSTKTSSTLIFRSSTLLYMLSWANLLNPPLGGLSIQSVSQPSAQITPRSLSRSYNIELNRQTTLDIIDEYGAGTYMEYPETKENGRVGHLFTALDLEQWPNPATYFAYSLGPPKGANKIGYCNILLNNNGMRVPCRVSHFTCM